MPRAEPVLIHDGIASEDATDSADRTLANAASPYRQHAPALEGGNDAPCLALRWSKVCGGIPLKAGGNCLAPTLHSPAISLLLQHASLLIGARSR